MTITDSRPANVVPSLKPRAPAGPGSLSGQARCDSQAVFAAEGQDSPQASRHATTSVLPPAGTTITPPVTMSASSIRNSPEGDKASHGQSGHDTHPALAVAADIPGGQSASDPHGASAAGEQVSGRAAATVGATPNDRPPLADPILKFTAQRLWDLEQIRIGIEHRVRLFKKNTVDSDGHPRGSGVTDEVLAVARVRELVSGDIDAAGIVAHLEDIARSVKDDEHAVELYLLRQWRSHPLYPWAKSQKGLAAGKQVARLIGAIGDPYWNDRDNCPRSEGALNRYCGMDVVDGEAPKRRAGRKGTWSPQARSRLWLVAESCKRQLCKPCAKPEGVSYAVHVEGCTCSPYRIVYDAARAHYEFAVHDKPCERCAPGGHPAPAGSPLSDGHKQARGLRAAAKAILADLRAEAERLHGLAASP